MSLAQQVSACTQSFALSATSYLAVGCGSAVNSTSETNNSTICRTAGTFSEMSIYQQTSLASGATVRFRKNTANGNQVISVGGGVTGVLQDLSNTDSVTAGDSISFQYTNATAANTRVPSFGVVFDDGASSSVYRMITRRDSFSTSTASTTSYFALCGTLPNTNATVEADAQFKNKLTATLRKAAVYVSANARGTATTLRSRVNGGNGNISISIGASTTGTLEDTSNSDSIVNADLVCTSITTGTGAGTITVRSVIVEYVVTSSSMPLLCGSPLVGAVNSASTVYNGVGSGVTNNTTETNISAPLWTSGTLSNLQCYVSANTIAATSTIKSRIAAADGNLTLSIGSTATGYFEDTLNSDTVTSTDRIATKLVVGTSATNTITVTMIGVNVLYDYPVDSTGILNFWLGMVF